MKSMRFVLLFATSVLVSGCATRGSINITCAKFAPYVLARSQLVADIQSDAVATISVDSDRIDAPPTMPTPAMPPETVPPKTGLETISASVSAMVLDDARRAQGVGPLAATKPRAILLLSGGGQWGAFGSGFLGELKRLGGDREVDFGVITGVSTGGLQSLFVAIDSPEAYEALRVAYSPKRENLIVNRNPKPLAIVTGSLAGLKPLRKKIEAALCAGGDLNTNCPLITSLAKSGRSVFIGFVKANTGEFMYADATAIAKTGDASASREARKNAQQCLTGIALASAAMPVFFQQVRINEETYYDGGVRLSVFEQNTVTGIDNGVKKARDELLAKGVPASLAASAITIPDLYVVRNGPTVLLGADGKPGKNNEADGSADALTAAFRAESIVVNQLEVGSIAQLRLAHPRGVIRLVTADGYGRARPGDPDGCEKPKGVMFDPHFMLCLQRFGRAKAGRQAPWIELSELPKASPAPAGK